MCGYLAGVLEIIRSPVFLFLRDIPPSLFKIEFDYDDTVKYKRKEFVKKYSQKKYIMMRMTEVNFLKKIGTKGL